ncbi:hypothetical protein LWI29_004526 [Acer saccharum]|uniref:Exostosin GT47 domain-containing protein n=1 Tax=Acer saccharum TaxID=4024 RepID=A0AA39W1Z2_ACESA|nr:hypothetical protein LWI29_004526 [Acer saccharum]
MITSLHCAAFRRLTQIISKSSNLRLGFSTLVSNIGITLAISPTPKKALNRVGNPQNDNYELLNDHKVAELNIEADTKVEASHKAMEEELKFFHMHRTSKLFPVISQDEYSITLESLIGSSPISTITQLTIPVPLRNDSKKLFSGLPETGKLTEEKHPSQQLQSGLKGNSVNDIEVYHDGDIFQEDYKEMNRSFKIYVYPISQDDPYGNILMPKDLETKGNYSSEHYFKQVLTKNHFITNDPKMADLFFMPLSVANMRVNQRIDVPGIQYFVRDYVLNISQKYPYWNQTGGADHFYVTCHSIGKQVTLATTYVKLNAIKVLCSANCYDSAYIHHKDASMPHIWPRHEDPPNLASLERKKLAFFAGSNNSQAHEKVHRVWGNDSEILVHSEWVSNIVEEQLRSKFCLHVEGYEVNTAHVADSLFYGCVPVIIADYHHLPFADIINWKSFSMIVEQEDLPLMKKILKGRSSKEYSTLQRNVLKVRKHFQWHFPLVEYDAFYMTMYELWLRRSCVKVQMYT